MNRIATIVAAAVCLVNPGLAQQVDVPLDSELVEEEELRRYSVEVILFIYDPSITAGTEVFEPDPRAPLAIQEALPIDDPFGLDPAVGQRAFDHTNDGGRSLAEPAADRPAASRDDAAVDPFADAAEVREYGDSLPMPGEPIEAPLEDVPLVDLIGADTIGLEFIPQEELTLVGAHEQLILLDAYRPVLWAGWTQLVRPEEETPVIHLRRLGPIPLEVSGTLKLYLSRFLHLVADLDLEAAAPPLAESSFRDDEGNNYRNNFGNNRRGVDNRYGAAFGFLRDEPTPVIHYRIREDRIINSGDLRYFDHPRFGLLARLTRVEAPEVDDEALLPAESPATSDDTGDLLPR